MGRGKKPSVQQHRGYDIIFNIYFSHCVQRELFQMEKPFGIDIIKNTNLSLAFIGTIASLFGLSVINERLLEWIQLVFNVSIMWLIFYGMAKVKSWVVIFILFYSYLSLLAVGLEFFTLQPDTSVDLLIKGILVLFICLNLFQIFIFSISRTSIPVMFRFIRSFNRYTYIVRLFLGKFC